MYKCICLLFLFAGMFNTSILYGQEAIANPRKIHTQRIFLKMVHIRYDAELKKIDSIQQTELSTINQLVAMKDKLSDAKEINDSFALIIGNKLLLHQQRVDSINALTQDLSKEINTYSKIKRNYSRISRQVDALTADVWGHLPDRRNTYQEIEKEMDIPDLSQERGALKTVLQSAAAQQKKEATKLNTISNNKDQLLASGNIDPTISAGVDRRIRSYTSHLDSMSREITLLSNKLESPEEYRNDRPIIKAQITLIDSLVNKNAYSREFTYVMMEEGLSKAKKNQFSLAAFFGPGGYIIPAEKYGLARKYFSPIIDSLVKFSNKYSTLFRLSSIIIHGYADATSIPAGSPLYHKLVKYMGITTPTKEELNKGLSALRAEQISRFLNMVVKERSPEFETIQKIVFEFVEFGQGEKFPDPAIIDYKPNDERRRIVVLYWSVLPNI